MSDYSVARLKQVVNPFRPITYGIVQCGPDTSPEGVPYIRPVDMGPESISDPDSLQRTSIDIASAYRRSVVRPGDLIVSIGPSFGKVAIVPDELDGANLTQGTARLAPGPRIEGRFLFWALRSTPVGHAWDLSSTGATFRALTLGGLGEAPVHVPPLPTQHAIADFLDRKTAAIDALIEKKQKLLDLLAEKRTALINRAVTKGLDPSVPMKDSGVPWIGEIPAHWEVKRLKHLIRSGTSISYGIVQPGDHDDSGVPFLQTANITNNTLPDVRDLQRTAPEVAGQYPRSRLEPGDVILGIRASIGAVHVVPTQYSGINLSRGIARIVPSAAIGPNYLSMVLGSLAVESYWRLARQGSTFLEVSIGSVRELPVPVPPRPEQLRIRVSVSKRVEHLDSGVVRARTQVDKLREYRQALITAAVTGQIDVEAA